MRFRLFFSFFIIVLGALPGELWARSPEYFIDPVGGAEIWRVQIPFVPKSVLKASDLPRHSVLHPGVEFGTQKFTHLSVSPDGKRLAFSVNGKPHDWTGVYDLNQQKIRQLSFVLDGEALAPSWSPQGRYLAVGQRREQQQRSFQIVDMVEESSCQLTGALLGNKFLNFLEPWWNVAGDKIFFKVEYNNVYRRSLGRKARRVAARIGQADLGCRELILYQVSEFMEKFPEEVDDKNFSSISH